MKSFAELNRDLFKPADPVIDRFEILWATPKELNQLKDVYQPSHVALSWLSAIDPDSHISFRLKAKILNLIEQSKSNKDYSTASGPIGQAISSPSAILRNSLIIARRQIGFLSN